MNFTLEEYVNVNVDLFKIYDLFYVDYCRFILFELIASRDVDNGSSSEDICKEFVAISSFNKFC